MLHRQVERSRNYGSNLEYDSRYYVCLHNRALVFASHFHAVIGFYLREVETKGDLSLSSLTLPPPLSTHLARSTSRCQIEPRCRIIEAILDRIRDITCVYILVSSHLRAISARLHPERERRGGGGRREGEGWVNFRRPFRRNAITGLRGNLDIYIYIGFPRYIRVYSYRNIRVLALARFHPPSPRPFLSSIHSMSASPLPPPPPPPPLPIASGCM